MAGRVLLSCLLGTTQFVREKTVNALASFNIDLSCKNENRNVKALYGTLLSMLSRKWKKKCVHHSTSSDHSTSDRA